MFHPSRGGVRGGRDQFTWDSVKEDKYREFYIGHSLKAPVGRWQKGKDLQWYTRDKTDATNQANLDEIAKIKQAEAEAMAEALGIKKPSSQPKEQISQQELRSVLQQETEGLNESDEPLAEATESHGIGFGRLTNRSDFAGSSTTEILPGDERVLKSGSPRDSSAAFSRTAQISLSHLRELYRDQDRDQDRDQGHLHEAIGEIIVVIAKAQRLE
ncbi:uncharacterized protein VTP21DRAFT_7939 [Calcarisporiella thermophila]|uniref:uncharacterized protein n=1 Tax=Calcarisporiella thermophila TaxID=911321 RepID=UPI003743F9D6